MEETVKRSRKSKMKKTAADMEALKWEIAGELGLREKVRAEGWAALTAAESGRLGGILAGRKKQNEREENAPPG